MRNGIPPLLSNRKRYKGSNERLVLFFPHNGTSAALPPHQSKFLRVGARGAVSYTHLDVYKRQVRNDLVFRFRVIADDPDNVMRQGMPVTVTLRKDGGKP